MCERLHYGGRPMLRLDGRSAGAGWGGHVYIERNAVIFGVWEGGWGEVPIIRCDVEVRVRPKLIRLVVRMDGGFKTTGLGPWTYLLSPSMGDSGAFWHKTSGTSDDA